VILLGNNLINASAATLTTIITLRLFGEGEWALSLATLLLTFAILVFSEVTPKVIGAAYPERIALPSSYILSPLLRLLSPVVWFVNLFVQAILRLLRLQPPASGPQPLTQQELRTLVLEAGRYIPAKHQSMLLSLLELEGTTVDDIMVPRQQIESIDLEADDHDLRHQLATCHHNRVLVCRGSADDVVGLLHVRRILHLWESDEFSREALEAQVRPPVFVPSGSNLLSQLQSLQEQRERMALVIDEYGEILGLLALEDVLEEIVGEFTTQSPHRTTAWAEDADGGWVIDGSAPLRDLNLLPMAASIWSCPKATMLAFPLRSFVQFCHNHHLLQVDGRPQWLTVRGGARTYLQRMHRDIPVIRAGAPVAAMRRLSRGVELVSDGSREAFDAVVLACHSDQALALLGEEASDEERAMLSAVRYQPNRALLHSDPALLPRRRKVWSAWNYLADGGASTDRDGEAPVAVSYLINMLQPLPFERPVVVTLNPFREPDPALVWREIHYSHPVFDSAAIAAQARLPALQGRDRVWFAGAWTGYGFHEDGLRSAVNVARDFGVAPPWPSPGGVDGAHTGMGRVIRALEDDAAGAK